MKFIIERCDNEAKRGYNRALRVHKMQNNTPVCVGANYELQSGGASMRHHAIQVVKHSGFTGVIEWVEFEIGVASK